MFVSCRRSSSARSKVTIKLVVNRFETLVNFTLSARSSIHAWPCVTIGLIVVNLLSFLLFSHMDRAREQRLALRGLAALVYFQQHPYLALKAPLDEFIERPAGVKEPAPTPSSADVGSHATRSTKANVDHALIGQQQAELDGKVSAFAQVAAELNTASLGYVPRARNGWALITYQFMHGSWLHLLGNLCFLWLLGAKLERNWGRTCFAGFYLTSGIAAATAHQLLASHSAVPLIGASGAIAGLLGAFTLRWVYTGVHLSIPHSLHWRAWRLRAPLLVLAWFGLELAQVILLPQREGSSAHFAHVGGFAFGFVIAWVLRRGGLESPKGGQPLIAAN